MRYENTYIVTVKYSFAKTHQLKMIGDSQKISNQSRVGFTLGFIDRQNDYKRLQEKYHLNLSIQSMEPALRC